MERKNINRSLPGLRMEDQGERSPQTFLVNNFSFLQPRRKQAPCAYYKLACVAGVLRGGGGGGIRSAKKGGVAGGGGGRGTGTPAIKAPIGSFLRSLAAAKF